MSDAPFKSIDPGRLFERIRLVCLNSGVDSGPAPRNEDEMIQQYQKAYKVTQRNIQRAMERIKQAKIVDFCFLIDATISMRGYMKQTMSAIQKVVKTLKRNAQNPGGIERLRFAVVAYRDFVGDDRQTRQIETFNFSELASECMEFCNSIEEFGGDDPPEDVFGGLEAATRLDWSKEAGVRILFHVCDSPCHGVRFHTPEMRDRFPEGDPLNLKLEDLFNEIKRMGIAYTFGKINDHTNQMLTEFSVAYGRAIEHFHVRGIASIADSVIRSISATVDAKFKESLDTAVAKVENPVVMDSREPDWSRISFQNCELIQLEPPNSIGDCVSDVNFEEAKNSEWRIKVASQPFDQGGEKLAFSGLDVMDNRLVVKEFKRRSTDEGRLLQCRTACEIQAVAVVFAAEFNDRVVSSTKLRFIPVNFVSFKDTGRVVTCERRLTSFVKFTNNLGYRLNADVEGVADLDIVALLTAFSHWTLEASDKNFIIVDLQGNSVDNGGQKVIELTDPSIHCIDPTRFSRTNLGKRGIDAFFETHLCNNYCEQLKLPDAKFY